MIHVSLRATPSQNEVIQSTLDNRITVCAAGRRFGKTHLAMLSLILHAMRKPRQRILFVGPTYSIAKTVYKELIFAPGFMDLVHSNAEAPEPWIRFKNNSVCKFLSMDKPNKKRGQGANFMVIDEAREIREADWEKVLHPFVAADRGNILLTSTFHGVDHWFTKIHALGMTENDLGVKSFTRPSSMGLGFMGRLGREELERHKSLTNETTWRCEYLCEPIQDGTFCFKSEHIDGCTTAYEQDDKKGSLLPTVLAWDLGGTYDPSALVIGDQNGRVLWTEILPLHQDWNDQAARVADLAKRFNSIVCPDTNGTIRDSVLDLLNPKMPNGIADLMIRHNNKQGLVNELCFALERRQIQLPCDATALIKQMRTYEVKSKGDILRFSCPDGHDDLVVAAMIYVHQKNAGLCGDVVSGFNV